jgi:predicted cupin superfamily sugar epimerase
MKADDIIRQLELQPHPEGGFYKETYRSTGKIPGLDRVYSTGIYYMLVPGAVSKFHSLHHDEMFHFYLGDPVTWVLLRHGQVEKVILGNHLGQGQKLQLLIPAGTWFGGYLNEGGQYGLMGTTVAPGFEFADFVFGSREHLLQAYPSAKEEVLRLT